MSIQGVRPHTAPDTPDITPVERTIIHTRLRDAGVSHAHTFDRSALAHVFKTPTTYLNCLVYLGLNLSLGSVSGFLPTIIKSFGYTNARAQLLTVPPYAVAFVGTLASSYLSDRLRKRGIFVVILMLLSAVGFAILIGVPHQNGARYFATFLVVLGAFSNIPLMLSWAANTAGSHSAAAVRLGFMNSVGQCFSSESSRRRHQRHSATLITSQSSRRSSSRRPKAHTGTRASGSTSPSTSWRP